MILALLGAALAAPSPMHPAVPLLDLDGHPVAVTLAPVSTLQTCGACHDTDYIASHGYHSEAGLDNCLFERLRRVGGTRHVGGGPLADTVELDCFLCHLRGADVEARRRTLAAGQPAWAATATLAQTGLVEPAADGAWAWRAETLADTAAAGVEQLPIQAPATEACGACHGTIWTSDEPLQLDLEAPCSTSTGQVFSGQRLSDSALPLADKEALSRPWDVHAEHLLGCVACHPSPNNPAFFHEPQARRPGHLRFDGRRLDLGEYLERPSHDFAKGRSLQYTVAEDLDGSMRRCEDCHDASQAHAWLPRRGAHLRALACEACHVPMVYAPARESLDWTLPAPDGRPHQRWRGIDGDPEGPDILFTGYQPLLLVRQDPEGTRLFPTNLTTTFFWVQGDDDAQVDPLLVAAAAAPGGAWAPALLALLDQDGDGDLAQDEAVLGTDAAVQWLADRLVEAGVPAPRIQGELRVFGLHHGVAEGEWATRACSTCHTAVESQVGRNVELARHVPAGASLSLARAGAVELPGRIERSADGALFYLSSSRVPGLYLPGDGASRWVDLLGVLALLGTVLGVGVHGGLRILSRRRRSPHPKCDRREP